MSLIEVLPTKKEMFHEAPRPVRRAVSSLAFVAPLGKGKDWDLDYLGLDLALISGKGFWLQCNNGSGCCLF